MANSNMDLFSSITKEAVCRIMGIEDSSLALTTSEMARNLTVTVFPEDNINIPINIFLEKLSDGLIRNGVRVISWDQAIFEGRRGKIREDIIVLSPGFGRTGNLPVDYSSNIRNTTIVGILDEPCPANEIHDEQKKLHMIVQTLAWSIYQIVIFVEKDSWTMCTANGAIITYDDYKKLNNFVEKVFIPRIAAPIKPPSYRNYKLNTGTFNPKELKYYTCISDFIVSCELWQKSHLLSLHIPLSSLQFRNSKYRRIVRAFSENRSGMSYGFLAKQLPSSSGKVMKIEESLKLFGNTNWIDNGFCHYENHLYVVINMGYEKFVVEVPSVEVIVTRSGCKKTDINPNEDLLIMRLSNGLISFDTPSPSAEDIQPSFDTLVILAHAVSNTLIAAILKREKLSLSYVNNLRKNGYAIAHWHGYIKERNLPEGYSYYGKNNIPVSCSTHQSAIFALSGKLNSLRYFLTNKKEYQGDIHVEPLHGTNITGKSLYELAEYLCENG